MGQDPAVCTRNWQLYWPSGREGPAFLIVPLADGGQLWTKISPSVVKLVEALVAARRADAAVAPPEARGWRLRARLAKQLFVEEDTIKAYTYRLQRDFAAAQRAHAVSGLQILESYRGLGLRLAVEDIDLLDREQALA